LNFWLLGITILIGRHGSRLLRECQLHISLNTRKETQVSHACDGHGYTARELDMLEQVSRLGILQADFGSNIANLSSTENHQRVVID